MVLNVPNVYFVGYFSIIYCHLPPWAYGSAVGSGAGRHFRPVFGSWLEFRSGTQVFWLAKEPRVGLWNARGRRFAPVAPPIILKTYTLNIGICASYNFLMKALRTYNTAPLLWYLDGINAKNRNFRRFPITPFKGSCSKNEFFPSESNVGDL